MKKKFFGVILITILTLLATLPFVVFAQMGEDVGGNPSPDDYDYTQGYVVSTPQTSSSCSPTIEDAGDVLCKFSQLLNSLLPVLVSLGVLYFVWGVVQYMIGSDEEAKKKGRDRIIFGIIGLSIIVGLWGLVAIVVNTFDLNNTPVYTNISSNLIFNSNQGDSDSCAIGPKPKLQNLLTYATCIISTSVIPLIFALATVMFIWGVVQFVINSDEEAKKAKGKQFMLWGIISLAVMVSVWGLVRILGKTFSIDYAIPQVKNATPEAKK